MREEVCAEVLVMMFADVGPCIDKPATSVDWY